MIHYYEVIGLLLAHYVGDYLFQDNHMAQHKSSNNYVLFKHVFIYTFFIWMGASIMLENEIKAFVYSISTLAIHFIQDYVTSRWNKQMLEANNQTMFHRIIGFDQLLHNIQLVSLYVYINHTSLF